MDNLANRNEKETIALEEERLHQIRRIVDSACMCMSSGVLTQDGALDLLAETRHRVLELAPDDGDKFDLIYAPRLRRLADQFSGITLNPPKENTQISV